jgi:hypothetical protein
MRLLRQEEERQEEERLGLIAQARTRSSWTQRHIWMFGGRWSGSRRRVVRRESERASESLRARLSDRGRERAKASEEDREGGIACRNDEERGKKKDAE